jgi:hypothetical protein
MPSDCWPTPEELRLLRSALLRGEPAARAWEAWKEGARLPLRASLARLLPAVWANLGASGPPDPWLEAAEAEYLRARYRNLLRLDDAARVLNGFREEGVGFLLLKGAALIAAHYLDPGLRPMVDVDVLVRRAEVERAVAILREKGYTPATPVDPASRAIVHSAPFERPGASPIDLHWRAVDLDGDENEALWAGACEASLAGAPALVPDPADLLLNACLQGLAWEWDAPQRWVLDAMTIVRGSVDRLDWRRLIELAVSRHATVNAHDALLFLREEFGAAVPEDVLGALASGPVSRWERLAARSRRTRPDLRGPLLAFALRFDDYQRLARRGVISRGPASLLQVWRRSWGLDHLWELPGQAAARGVRRGWQLLRHGLLR